MLHISKEKLDLLIKRKNEMINIINEGQETDLEQYSPYLPEAAKDDDLALYYLKRDIIIDLMKIRIAMGLTQAEVAAKIGTKQTAISRFEKYNTEPTLEFMFKYARALGIELHITAGKVYPIILPESDYKLIELLASIKGIDIMQYASKILLNELHNGKTYQDLGLNLKSDAQPEKLSYCPERINDTLILSKVGS